MRAGAAAGDDDAIEGHPHVERLRHDFGGARRIAERAQRVRAAADDGVGLAAGGSHGRRVDLPFRPPDRLPSGTTRMLAAPIRSNSRLLPSAAVSKVPATRSSMISRQASPSLAAAASVSRQWLDCGAPTVISVSAPCASASATRNSSLRVLLPPPARPSRSSRLMNSCGPPERRRQARHRLDGRETMGVAAAGKASEVHGVLLPRRARKATDSSSGVRAHKQLHIVPGQSPWQIWTYPFGRHRLDGGPVPDRRADDAAGRMVCRLEQTTLAAAGLGLWPGLDDYPRAGCLGRGARLERCRRCTAGEHPHPVRGQRPVPPGVEPLVLQGCSAPIGP